MLPFLELQDSDLKTLQNLAQQVEVDKTPHKFTD